MIKVLVIGPALSQSGYGEQCRFALRSLRSREDVFDIYLKNLNWGRTSWLWEDNEERRWIDQVLGKTTHKLQADPNFDMTIQVTIPNEWQQLAPVNVGYTAGIETTRVAPGWIEKSFLMNNIIVPSTHSKNVYQGTRYEARNQETNEIKSLQVSCPVEVVNFCTTPEYDTQIELDLETDFNFLCVAQAGPRKNFDNTIKWFVEEFIDQEVGLVVKCSIANNSYIDRKNFHVRLQYLLSNPEYENRKCKIYVVHGYMKEDEMHALYKHDKIKAIVSFSHGEGFGLPLFEAAQHGLPVITSEWSGPCDYLFAPVEKKGAKAKRKPLFSRVSYDIRQIQKEAVWPGVLEEESMWCFPQEGSAKMKMRNVFKNHKTHLNNAKKLQKHIVANFSPEQQYEKFLGALPVDLDMAANAPILSEELEDMFSKLVNP